MSKILSCLLAVMMVLSLVPITVFAADEQAVGTDNEVATTESGSNAIVLEPGDDLQSLINAIPVGGSGEFTIHDTQWYLEFGLYVENRDITLNLVNAEMGTYSFENGTADPLILGFGANITLNLDENSRIEAQGHTGNMGVVRVDNSTDWNAETQTFPETFTLTVNGGSFNCVQVEENSEFEPDSVFVAAPGTKVVLKDVYCNGDVKEIDMAGVGIDVPGELVINSGKFTNDVSEYIADGHYCCRYTDKYDESVSHYFVREKEMTDEFKKVLTDGKVIFNYDKSIAGSDAVWLLCEDFSLANEGFNMTPEGFNDDFSKVEISYNSNTIREERHTVDVVWDYDEKVSEAAQEFIKKFPTVEYPWFNLTDMELVNYWAFYNPESEVDSLANYSGELKNVLGNSNFLYTIEVRGGSDEVFYTTRIGSAKLTHNDKVYFGSDIVGARAQHAIYVPENTGDTAEELIAAAQKRIDDYIGEDIVKITYADSTVTEYYNSEIANYDAELLTVQTQLQEARDTLAAEKEKPEGDWNYSVISDCEWTIMQNESRVQELNDYKNYFVECFEEGNDYHFLKSAAGDFFFNIEVLRTGEVFRFVIIKDDTKLAFPSYASVDFDTKVTIETDDSDVPLDTIINVDKLTEGTDYDKIMDVLNDIENEMFDIKLHSGSLNRFFTKLANGKFEVKIPVPEKFSGKNLVVYYVDANNKPVEYEVNVKDGFAIFSTDHFSIYTLAEKHEHSYTEKITKEPTCTESGEKVFTCGCGDSYSETITSTGHTSVKGGTEKAHTICSVCKVPLSTDHKITSKVTTNPTCTKEGVETFTCECGYTYTKPVAKLGHDKVSHSAKSATCEAIGWYAYDTCSRCDYTTYKEIAKLGHDIVIDKAVEATCTKTGLTEGSHCSRCDDKTVKQEVVPSTGHKTSIINKKDATCTADGYTGDIYCSNCKTTTEKGSVIKATGHKDVTVTGKAATCIQSGLTDGKKCSVCGTVTKAQETIKATGHKEVSIPAVASTCTAVGKTEGKKCSVCGTVTLAQKDVAKLAHETTVVNKKDATCTAEGYTGDTQCTVCKTVTAKGTAVAKLDHQTTVVGAKPATAKEAGYTGDTKCTVCGTVTQKGTTIAKLTLAAPKVTQKNTAKGISLTWGKVENAESYRVYRRTYNTKTKKYSEWTTLSKAQKGTSFVDTKVKLGTTYSYMVKAINSGVLSKGTPTKNLKYNVTPTVTVANASKGISVSWSPIANATGYEVYSSTYNAKTKKWSSFTKRATAKANAKSWTDTKAKSGTKYKYTVKALNGKVASAYNKSGVQIVRLAQPTTKIVNASNGIKVSWGKVTGATSYEILRADYNAKTKKWNKAKKVATAKSSATSWTDKKVKSGVQYRYTVKAVNGKVYSSYKTTSGLMFLTMPKTTVKAVKNGVTVTWTQSTGATSYEVYRAEYNKKTKKYSGYKKIATAKSTAKSYTDKTAKKGVKYKYTVKAVNNKTASAYKEVVVSR